MNLIICLDDNNGYSFANRRQSKDKVQLDKMMKTVGENRLFLNSYSAKLFETLHDNIAICEDPLNAAKKDDFCFVENIDINIETIDKVIIYRWNRVYPYDKIIPEHVLKDKKLISSVDFVGNSHDKITEEIFV